MNTVLDVLANGMCAGCGLCAQSPDAMKIDSKGFLRPVAPLNSAQINQACPGRRVEHFNRDGRYDTTWGPIQTLEAGYALDPVVRQGGSSGGVLTAILRHLLEKRIVDAVIQTGASQTDPIRNVTEILSDSNAVVKNAGSRYGPSSPLSVIQGLVGNGKTYAFLGKPCDVAALRAFLHENPQHQSQFPVLLSFFCAGVPSEHGTEAILQKMNFKRSDTVAFKYRGDGWPGLTTATRSDGRIASMTYNESWGTILNRHLQARCKLCADGIGEAADIVCADAWYESNDGYPSFEELPGRSLIISRTRVGENLLRQVVGDGVIETSSFERSELDGIQPYQAFRKRTSLARSIALKTLFSGAPKFVDYRLVDAARQTGLKSQLRTFLGTLYRKCAGRI